LESLGKLVNIDDQDFGKVALLLSAGGNPKILETILEILKKNEKA
jgi:hypothetical protein